MHAPKNPLSNFYIEKIINNKNDGVYLNPLKEGYTPMILSRYDHCKIEFERRVESYKTRALLATSQSAPGSIRQLIYQLYHSDLGASSTVAEVIQLSNHHSKNTVTTYIR